MSKTKKTKHPFSLRAVYLREAKQWLADDFDPILPGQQLFGQFKASSRNVKIQEVIENIENAKPIRSCRFTTNFHFRYLNAPLEKNMTDDMANKSLVAEITAQFTVDYLIGTPEKPSEEMLKQWASSNALLHCWPYWREFCHSTLLRMNLPVTMMPMMEIKQAED